MSIFNSVRTTIYIFYFCPIYSINLITGHQGTGVLSYFIFLRWLFLLNIAIFCLVFFFIVIPYVAFASEGYTSAVLGDGTVSGVDTSKEATCSPLYVVNVSSSASTLIQDFLQGSVRWCLFPELWNKRSKRHIGITWSSVCLSVCHDLPLLAPHAFRRTLAGTTCSVCGYR